MLITVHRWFANKSCPGDWLYARLGDLAAKVTSRLGSGNVEVIPSGMQAGEFQGLTEEQVLAKVGLLFTADQKKSGISLRCLWPSLFWRAVMERVSLRWEPITVLE